MFEILILTAAVWLAYFYAIENGFVSDDIEGLIHYDGKLKKFDYGHLNKWLLYKLLDKSPQRNHLFSIFLHNANVILLFSFLISFLPIKLAFFTSLLFAIHPITTQAVAWISGRGYPISLFFCLLGFNLVSIASKTAQLWTTAPLQSLSFALLSITYGCIYYLSISAQFAALATFILQTFFGNYFLSLIGLAISSMAGMGIIKEVIGLRTKVFKEQNLGASTSFKISKIIVAIKSLGYYTRFCLFPKRMGLYHTYEYHYSEKTEKEDKWFWFGFLILLSLIAGFIFGDTAIKFAILWYVSYLFIFLNWITIQQFVSERYLYIPSIGICLLTAYGLINIDKYLFSGYPVITALVIGIYLMRTWVHLPTYQDEVLFYQSNVWNFPDSEVAFSNLGVVYMKCSLVGSAVDMWQIAGKINPQYDVAWYNIHSVLRQKGDFVGARDYLKKAVDSPQCHFKEKWAEELKALEHEMQYMNEINQLNQQLSLIEKDPNKQQEIINIKKQLEDLNNLHKIFEERKKDKLVLIQQEENGLKTRLIELQKTKEELNKGLSQAELIKARDMNFNIIKESVNNISKQKVINANT